MWHLFDADYKVVVVGQATSTTDAAALSQAVCRNNDAESGEGSLAQVS